MKFYNDKPPRAISQSEFSSNDSNVFSHFNFKALGVGVVLGSGIVVGNLLLNDNSETNFSTSAPAMIQPSKP